MRHDDIHGGHQRPVAAHRDDAARRRIGAERVVGCRRAPARPGLFAETEGGERGCRCRAGAVGRSRTEGAGQPFRIVGAFGASIEPALHAAIGHRRHVGQAKADRAGPAQALDGEGIALGGEVREGGAAGGGRQPPDQIAVLGGVGNAVERREELAPLAAVVGCLRLGQRIRVHHHQRIERGRRAGRIIGLDARQIGLNQLHARHRAGLERRPQLGDRLFHDIEAAHGHAVPAVTAGCCCVMQ